MTDLVGTCPKEYPIIFSRPMVRAILEGRKTVTRRLPTSMWATAFMRLADGEGVRLWVRERCWIPDPVERHVTYHADHGDDHAFKWTPSIHMPRWASRIRLDVVSMRKEQLRDISESDARAEGLRPIFDGEHPELEPTPDGFDDIEVFPYRTPLEQFPPLWDSLHRKPGTTWADNPEVWRIEFKPVSPKMRFDT